MNVTAIQEVLHRQPFRPFTLRLADGRTVPIPHPDFIAVSPRTVIVIHQDESFSILEPLLIVSTEGEREYADIEQWILMAEELTFLMGKFPAVLPGDRRYARNHMWAREESGGLRFGFTSYAIRLMKDVYFLDWCVSAGDAVGLLQQIGNIETSKAVSDLFAPVAGTVRAFNGELLKDPSGINVDGYGVGWLFEMDGANGPLLSVVEYHEYLTANWDKTQRLIKGKINTESED